MISTDKINRVLVVLSLVVVSLVATAAPPDLQTKGRVIYLADNLDEADNLGWCIDTVGRGFADTLHAHSCKPQGGDVQFEYSAEQHRIQSVAFAGNCMSLIDPDNAKVPFGLVPCDSDDARQGFVFDSNTGRIQLQSSPNQCVVVGESSRSAGPFMSRNLIMANCENAEAELSVWVYQSDN